MAPPWKLYGQGMPTQSLRPMGNIIKHWCILDRGVTWRSEKVRVCFDGNERRDSKAGFQRPFLACHHLISPPSTSYHPKRVPQVEAAKICSSINTDSYTMGPVAPSPAYEMLQDTSQASKVQKVSPNQNRKVILPTDSILSNTVIHYSIPNYCNTSK